MRRKSGHSKTPLTRLAHESLGGRDLARIAVEGDPVAAHMHLDAGELVLETGQQPILRAKQPHHRETVDLEFGMPERALEGRIGSAVVEQLTRHQPLRRVCGTPACGHPWGDRVLHSSGRHEHA